MDERHRNDELQQEIITLQNQKLRKSNITNMNLFQFATSTKIKNKVDHNITDQGYSCVRSEILPSNNANDDIIKCEFSDDEDDDDDDYAPIGETNNAENVDINQNECYHDDDDDDNEDENIPIEQHDTTHDNCDDDDDDDDITNDESIAHKVPSSPAISNQESLLIKEHFEMI